MEQAGIGQVEVAAFALRLASILLQRPPVRKLLVLDEPFKSIRGKHYKKRVRGLLLMLAERYGVQLILCADVEAYPELMLGSVVEVE
jgi:ABC-type Mn2+/Zn2+ transport system ATPase subunit